MKRIYRSRPERGKNKPYTIHNPETATLLDWLKCYSATIKHAAMWYANMRFSRAELKAVYDYGLHATAIELGYLPYQRPATVDFSQPIVTRIAPPEAAGKVAA